MKILFAIKTLDASKGGAEKVLADVTSGLAEKSHKISVLSFDAPGGQAHYPLHQKVHRITLGVGNVARRATLNEFFTRALTIRKTAKRLKPDAVVAFMHSTFIPTSFALIGTGIPVIASEHIVPKHYKDRWWEFMLLSLSLKFVKKITVLSSKIIESYPRGLRKKMISIPNAVDITNIKPKKQDSTPKKERKTILSVGRLTKQKDQILLIRAFAKIANDNPDWGLRIIGEGELRDKLERKINAFKMNDRIFLPGITQAIGEEYSNADIFALPSRYESFGLATAEAMAFGLPAIGFEDCQGTNELITHNKNGLLIPRAGDQENLQEALQSLIDSRVLRVALGAEAKKEIKKYAPKIIIQKWENLIKEVVEENGGQTGIRTLDGL